MAKVIKVKNNKGTDDIWVGQTIVSGAEFTLDPTHFMSWSTDSKVLTDAVTGDLGVSDGATYLSTGSARVDWLKGAPIVPVGSSGAPIMEHGIFTGIPGARALSCVTPNLADRTTWYQKSVKVTAETLTDSGDGLTFNSVNPYWIDIMNLKLTYSYKQIFKRDGTFGKQADWVHSVSVNGTPVTTGFTVNFVDGTITFGSSQSGNTVTATYWTNNGVTQPSEWLLVPPAGHKFTIQCVELQYSTNIPAAFDTIRFEIWAGANLATYGSFPDYLYDAGYGQFRADYRSVWDIINVTNNMSSAVIPAHGPMNHDLFIAPFNYTQATLIDSAVGTIMRCCLVNNIPIPDVDLATACFYMQLI